MFQKNLYRKIEVYILIFAIVLTCCKCKASPGQDNADKRGITIKQGTTDSTLSFFLKNNSAYPVSFNYLDFYYDDIAFKLAPGEEIKITSEQSLWLYYNAIEGNTFYLLFPGDSVYLFWNSAKDFPLLFTFEKNKKRDMELNVFAKSFTGTGKSYGEIFKPYIIGKKDHNYLEEILYQINDKYNRQENNIQQYVVENDFPKEFKNYCSGINKMDFFNKQLPIIWNNFQLSQYINQYKNRFDSAFLLVNSFFKDDHYTTNNFKEMSYWYFVRYVAFKMNFDLFRGGAYSSPPADSLYRHALEISKDDKAKNLILFLIVKEELKTRPNSVSQCIQSFFSDCTDEKFKFYLHDMAAINNSKAESGKDEIISTDFSRANLNQFMEKQKGNVILIDLWASWCMPCREEFPNAAKLREKYKDKPVVFLYLSIDNNINLWRKAVEQEKMTDYPHNYLLYNFEKSAFNKRYKVGPIPRHILIDKKGKVVNANAPGPDDAGLITKLDKLVIEK